MAVPSTSSKFSSTTPAAPAGQQNVVPQSDGSTPQQSVSFADPIMVGDTGSGGLAGNVPVPAAGDAAAGKFLKADGTFQVPPGGGAGSMSYLGDWAAGAYAAGAVVRYSGALYLCTLDVGSSSPVVVQSAAAVQVRSLAFTSNVTAGNLLVIAFGDEGTVDPSTVTDSIGTTYTKAAAETGNINNLAIYYGIAPSSGANTVSYTSGGSYPKVTISEFSNANAVVNATASAYSNSASVSVLLTTTASACLIYAAIAGVSGITTFSPLTGFTLTAQANGSDAVGGEYGLAATATTYTAGFNAVHDGNTPLVAVAFESGALPPPSDTAHWMVF